MSAKTDKSADNSAAIAAQFGVSTKALRHYERLGMLSPPRSATGWRAYGRKEIERLHLILSLRQLGLPLARIAKMLNESDADLGSLLAVQEDALHETRREAERTLRLVQIARARLREKGDLTTEELARLVSAMSKTVLRWTPELEALAERIFTPEQRAKTKARAPSPEEAGRIGEAWARICDDIDAMSPETGPVSAEGLAIARRIIELIRKTTCGDAELWNAGARFWFEAVNDSKTAERGPIKKRYFDFMARTFAELQRRGELKP